MPFSFHLVVEFFFPGLILLTAFWLSVDLAFPSDVSEFALALRSSSATAQAISVLISGLVCYFLGAVINGVSNRFIRLAMEGFRQKMIRQKLGLEAGQALSNLPKEEQDAIARMLPVPKSDNRLNEVYAAARSYSATSSDRAGKLIDYHWSLVRLSRAALLPLVALAIVFVVRWVISHEASGAIGALTTTLLVFLTVLNYRYREKFLVYTAFDLFFISAKKVGSKENS